MELDDLKSSWTDLDRRVSELEGQATMARQSRVRRRSGRLLAGLTVGQAMHAIVWIVVIATVAPFWIEHRGVPHLLAAGLAVHLYGVAVVCASVVQLLVIGRTYYTAPVVEYQKRLAELARLRAIMSLALGLPWWVLWVPVTIVGAGLIGVDIVSAAPGWAYGSLGVGVIGACLTVVIGRRLGRQSRAPLMRRCLDGLSGRALARAVRDLDEIVRFGQS